MAGSATYSASATTVVAMAKGNGNSKGVRGGGSAGTNKVSLRSARPSPLPTEFRFRGLRFGRGSRPGWSNAGGDSAYNQIVVSC
jgi:hypothetical protein